MTRAIFRLREFRLVPDAEPDAEPVTFTMQCAVCEQTSGSHTTQSVSQKWVVRHLKESPEHLTYREMITRPYRFEPGAWL
ncbi:hypothetical protein ITI46_13925 [Streptomyces oryzae]|uniref:DUF7848 domain-containing protein n=1 Tax=Streptomyces oryzae TaxID=1434886 RepID=A0ABS3XCG9_9ACTN|nr:hypothetical protein [Streptomyces oryzae]MBO8192757.1 hypothetical protein [Streptomyces oryzae]